MTTDLVIDMVSEVLSKEHEGIDFKALYTSILTSIFSISKTTSEFDPKEKIKFISIASLPTDDGNYFGVCDIKQPSVTKTK